VSVFALRAATLADVAHVLPRTRALNDHEGIAVTDAALEDALRRLLADPSLGGVWLVERDGAPIGYAIVTFGYDLEFAGRDAWLTELWIDEAARGCGAGRVALEALEIELRAHQVRALHLQVRPGNPAMRVYERAGFAVVPRTIMSRRLT
jgi:ribosomal protein S18 acetylase RimI-like enzyme